MRCFGDLVIPGGARLAELQLQILFEEVIAGHEGGGGRQTGLRGAMLRPRLPLAACEARDGSVRYS